MTDPIFDIFREEAREHLGSLERGFLDLESAEVQVRRPLIDNLFRHAHSLKGDARAIGVGPLQSASQILEDTLDAMRGAPEQINLELINQGLAQLDLVRHAYQTWEHSMDADVASEQDIQSEIKAFQAETASPVPLATPVPDSLDEPTPQRTAQPQSAAPPASAALSQAEAVPAAPEVTSATHRDENFTVRVPSQRLDRMLNLAGEIRISQRVFDNIEVRLSVLHDSLKQLPLGSRHRRSVSDTEVAQLRAALLNWQSQMTDQLRHVESELRKKATREELLVKSLESDIRHARLLPLTMLTDSLRRLVRDLAQSLGKSIRYDVDVGKIMLDKAVIEALREPMLHLIRNAADHGLEPPAERQAAGKPEEGRIRIEATRQGESVAIRISDDGRGLNYDRIRERVRQIGGIDESDLLALTPQELSKFLFEPGFSTANAGDISGRGVGLDVVQTKVRQLHGTLVLVPGSGVADTGSSPRNSDRVESGTTFVISVPVTISTVRILTVLSGGQYYGIPTSAIVRTGSATEQSLRELEGSLVLSIEGQPVRWVPLCDLLGTSGRTPTNSAVMRPYLLIGNENRHVAVVVDDLEDESEVLLKPLGFPLSGLAGIIGGAVRPDGSIQVVLDIANVAFGKPEHREVRQGRLPRVSGRIMVVDDSPTTRMMLRNVFTAAGYMVRTACDGVDALERLRTQLVDLVVSDVEMPRMNGLDLTRHVKARLGLPVILVTGREKEEHRREGLEAGADAYVVKSSFEGEGLLEVVKQFV